ncbi:MAG: manganese efflux pump MntP family protein [Butyricimonas faecihominis]
MGIISILLIAVGLAMDSLAVSISGGIVMRPFCMRQSLRLALTMGIFQGGMTLLGWLMGVSFSSYITAFDHWIAFILLGFLGGKMIYESFGEEETTISSFSTKPCRHWELPPV